MASSKLNYLMYADDTTLYFNLKDFDCRNLDYVINSEIEKINLWLKLNKLSLNADKTEYDYDYDYDYEIILFRHKQNK